jgi:hypothetical protein
MKCIFEDNPICQGCLHRGSQCVSQDLPEDVASTSTVQSDMRTIYTPSSVGTPQSIPGNRITNAHTPEILSNILVNDDVRVDKTERLASRLHEALPSLEDTTCILKASLYSSVLALASLTLPYNVIDKEIEEIVKDVLIIPGTAQHPVIIARHLLRLAACLHHLHPTVHADIRALSESPQIMMERLADTAISLVTTNEELLGSIEGLQCVMIESIYHTNKGGLRRGWTACRRAMSMAQMMGLNRPHSNSKGQFKLLDPKTKYCPQHMWLRIVSLERHLCLMLGLPQGSLDQSMTAPQLLVDDTPLGRLERMHCMLASRILERNEADPSTNDINLTQNLDHDLQRAAKNLPSKWWATPTLKSDEANPQNLFWEARRLFGQVFHYSLLIQLHLPYMLGSSSPEAVCMYSRMTCVNASREVILRFTTLRNLENIACDCRTIDFLALMAAMTLLIAHLEGQRLDSGNLLAHQYLSDRALIEQVQEVMARLHNLNRDSLSAQSASLLRRLLLIDAEGGQSIPTSSLTNEEDDIAVSAQTPYSAIIKIAREGLKKTSPYWETTSRTDVAFQSHHTANVFTPESLDLSTVVSMTTAHHESQNIDPDINSQKDDFSTLTRDIDEWALQGVDMAFFDSLIRSTGST